jgi:hypothetical protein
MAIFRQQPFRDFSGGFFWCPEIGEWVTSGDFACSRPADSASFCGHMAAVDCGSELAGYLGFHWYALNCGRKIFDGDARVFQKEHDHWSS